MEKYDELLREIEILKLHSSYMPFIGEEYETHRCLHIGETHYLNQSKDMNQADDYPWEYFQEHWFYDTCDDLHAEEIRGRFIDTRFVLNNWMQGNPFDRDVHKKRRNNPSIFREYIRAFSEVILGKKIEKLSLNDREKTTLYRYSAYTDYFMFPCIIGTHSVYDGLVRSRKKSLQVKKLDRTASREVENFYYEQIVKTSTETLDRVIEILNPKAVVVTSKLTHDLYCKTGIFADNDRVIKGKYADDPRMIYLYHPEARGYWNYDELVRKLKDVMALETATDGKKQ